MSHQEYTQLLEYLDDRFSGIDRRLDKVESRLDGLDITIDRFMKWMDRNDQEHQIAISRIGNIEEWIKKPLQN